MTYCNLQVLSESVGRALSLTGGPKAEETAKFTSMFDRFFYALNVRNFTNGGRYRKPYLNPYRHEDHERLAVSCAIQYMFL